MICFLYPLSLLAMLSVYCEWTEQKSRRVCIGRRRLSVQFAHLAERIQRDVKWRAGSNVENRLPARLTLSWVMRLLDEVAKVAPQVKPLKT
jgi:hypothetical protein